MTWVGALSKALQLRERTGRRWYVRGYRSKDGWAYGCYAIPDPVIAIAKAKQR